MSFKFKSIRLFPTLFYLDVILVEELIEENKLLLVDYLHKRYGASKEYYLEDEESGKSLNYVCMITSTDKAEVEGTKVLLRLTELNPDIVVHEVIHILWKMNQLCDLEINESSEEWQAYTAEYLFSEILNNEGYETIS